TIYFWWRNTRGIHESSDDALRIMYVTTAMVALLILWCSFTILTRPSAQRLPPSPTPQNLIFNTDAVGWMPKLAPHALEPVTPNPPAAASAEAASAEPYFKNPANVGIIIGLI